MQDGKFERVGGSPLDDPHSVRQAWRDGAR